MSLNTVSFFNFTAASRSRDWTQQELAEFYRVEASLVRANIEIETDRGRSDEGDPWFVFCNARYRRDHCPFCSFRRDLCRGQSCFGRLRARARLQGVDRGPDCKPSSCHPQVRQRREALHSSSRAAHRARRDVLLQALENDRRSASCMSPTPLFPASDLSAIPTRNLTQSCLTNGLRPPSSPQLQREPPGRSRTISVFGVSALRFLPFPTCRRRTLMRQIYRPMSPAHCTLKEKAIFTSKTGPARTSSALQIPRKDRPKYRPDIVC